MVSCLVYLTTQGLNPQMHNVKKEIVGVVLLLVAKHDKYYLRVWPKRVRLIANETS